MPDDWEQRENVIAAGTVFADELGSFLISRGSRIAFANVRHCCYRRMAPRLHYGRFCSELSYTSQHKHFGAER
jgi:hypothetical protein